MKIVVLDGYGMNPGDLSWGDMAALGELTVHDRTAPADIIARAQGAEAILTNKVIITAETIAALPAMRYIGVLATGYNVVDIAAARKAGVIVTNIPAYSTDSVAQLTFAHILNITNRVDHYATQNRAGRWAASPDFVYWDTPLPEIAGKTIGIVGLGNIGSKVAQIARAFGMDVFAVTSKESAALPEGIHKTTLDGLLAISDILTLHCPLTESTRGMINATTIAKMKVGAILINTGRGPLVNEDDVAASLRTGHLAAYGADVMTSEPPAATNALVAEPHAFITPHIAWATTEARRRLMATAVANVAAYAAGTPQNVVS